MSTTVSNPVSSPGAKPGHAPRSPLLFMLSENACTVAGLSPEQVLNTESPAVCTLAQAALQKSFSRFFNIPAAAPSNKPADSTDFFSDAQLLLFPVRTMRGSFTWITSVERLDAFIRACKNCACAPRWKLPPNPVDVALIGPRNNCLSRKQVIVEQFGFQAQVSDLLPGITHWLADQVFPWGPEYQLWKRKLAQDLIVLPETSFSTIMAASLHGSSSGAEDQTSAISRQLTWSLPPDCLFYSVLAPELWDRKFESTHAVVQGENLTAPAVFGVRIVRHARRKRKKVTLRKDQTTKIGAAAPAEPAPTAAAPESPPKSQPDNKTEKQ